MRVARIVGPGSHVSTAPFVPQMLIVADDLTGAADTGGVFASAGIATSIGFPNEAIPRNSVVALFTDSRMLDSAAAGQLTTLALAGVAHSSRPEPRWIYKKIDSTLRGNPAAELFAVMDAMHEHTALVAPALPAEGRTTRDGHQYVDGIRLDRLPDAESGAQSSIRSMFQARPETPVHLLPFDVVRAGDAAVVRYMSSTGPGIIVADADNDVDLLTLSRAAASRDVRILCGSAGFARALSVVLPFTRDEFTTATNGHADVPVLVVAGSRQLATVAQVEQLELAGCRIIRPEPATLTDDASSISAVVARVASALKSGQSTVLTTTHLPPMSAHASRIANRLAEIATDPGVCEHVGGLVLTGGDIATAVLRKLHVRAIHLRGEIRPAMPWGMIASALPTDLPVATKAGGFGDAGALLACIEHFCGKLSV